MLTSEITGPRSITYALPEHELRGLSTLCRPKLKAFDALDSRRGRALSNDVLSLIERFNHAQDGTMVVTSGYAEVMIAN